MFMKKIMLIEDDKDLAIEISLALEKWGFQVDLIKDFQNLVEEYTSNLPQLVIMDINLPYFDGFYWCNKIRAISKVPILFLSSRDSNMDIIMGINNGGDDYITKPFDIDVLIMKITALLRRSYDYNANDKLIYYNNLIFDTEKGIIKKEQQEIELTKNEFKILKLLIDNKGKIVSRSSMMMSLWNDDEFVNDNTLTVNITRLRNKIKELGLDDFIKTKKGIGYMV